MYTYGLKDGRLDAYDWDIARFESNVLLHWRN